MSTTRRKANVPLKAEELRELLGTVVAMMERVTEIQRDAGAMLERLWEAQNSLDNLLARS